MMYRSPERSPRFPGMDVFLYCAQPHFLGRSLIWPGQMASRVSYLVYYYCMQSDFRSLRTRTTNCRVSFIDLYLVFPRNCWIAFLPHTNTVILLEPYCGTITEPGLPVVGLSRLSSAAFGVWSKFCLSVSEQLLSKIQVQWPLGLKHISNTKSQRFHTKIQCF